MTWGAVAIGGATLAGSLLADDGSGGQVAAGNAANQVSQAQYQQTRQDNMPFLRNGTAGSNELAYRLGLSSLSNASYGAAGMPDRNTIFNQYQAERLQDPSQTAYSGLNAADQMAVDSVVDQRYNQALQAAQQAALPGAQADPNYGSLTRNFTDADIDADPVYQRTFQTALNNGNQAVNRLAAAGGGLNSGATLKALTKFGADTANTYAGGAYDRFNNNNTQIYNRLAGISGSGQTAVNTMSQSGQQNAATVGNNLIGIGNARAAASVGAGNAINSGIGSVSNFYQQNQLLNSLNNKGSYSGYVNNATQNGFGPAFTQTGIYG